MNWSFLLSDSNDDLLGKCSGDTGAAAAPVNAPATAVTAAPPSASIPGMRDSNLTCEPAGADATQNAAPSASRSGNMLTCKTCLLRFDPAAPEGCSFHPGAFGGETRQRWLPPGVTKGAADIVRVAVLQRCAVRVLNYVSSVPLTLPLSPVAHQFYFYTCCGEKDVKGAGCTIANHVPF